MLDRRIPRPRRVATGAALVAALTVLATSSRSGGGTTARYRLTVDSTWSSATHPGAFPRGAHFSWLGGGTHDGTIWFWQVGELASPAIVQMAETGLTTMLEQEVEAAIARGQAATVLAWHHWFCPPETNSPSCGPTVVEFDVVGTHAHVTLVSMLGPTPDWFVGISGLPLRDAAGWIDEVVVDLRPYDGGTRAANAFALFGPLTVPPEPITLISERSGQLVGPGSLGSFTFERIDGRCPDPNGDGAVDVDDLVAVLLAWGTDGAADGTDLNGSGTVDVDDVLTVILAWGPCSFV